MEIQRGIVLLMTITLVAGGLTVGFSAPASTQDTERPTSGQVPTDVGTSESADATSETTGASGSTKYRLTVTEESALNRTLLEHYGEVGTQAGVHVEITLTRTNASQLAELAWVESIERAYKPIPQSSEQQRGDTTAISNSVQTAPVDGEDVRVGVIDFGFNTENDVIAGNVAAVRSFRESPSNGAHGTKVSETIARIAPESELYLTATGSGTDTEAAISYLVNQDVDVIVMSLGYYVDDDGEHFLTDDIREARESGVLFVNSAGNSAQAHWEGQFKSEDGDAFHEWAGEDELNCLPNCQTTHSGEVFLLLDWDQDGDRSEYQIGLYNPVSERRLAQSRRLGDNTAVLVADVAAQPLDVYVANTRGPADDRIEISAFRPESLQRTTPGSSLTAPADVSAATTVGAYQLERGQLAPYSSRGPTDDGRQGVDITGYTNLELSSGVFRGTSAAAPYVGGVAALVIDAGGSELSVKEVEDTLTETAIDLRQPGPDPATGAGLINGTGAIESARAANAQHSPTANVSIQRQTTDGSTVTVASTSLSDGGFVTIHDGSLLDGATFDSVRGTSDYLEPGEHSDIQVSLDTPYDENGTAIAMPHLDTNGNEEYDFVTSEGAEDGPYTSGGAAVTDSASITIASAVDIEGPATAGPVAPDETISVTYAFVNTGATDAAAGRIEFTTPEGVEPVSIDGNGTSGLSGSPPSVLYGFNGPIQAGAAPTTTVTFRISSDIQTGSVDVVATAFIDGSEQTASQQTTITVAESVVARFDTDGDGIEPREAQEAIVALNNGEISPQEAQQIIVALNQ